MSTTLANRVVELLANCPSGLSTREIAERLGATVGNISSIVSKLAAYGKIHQSWNSAANNTRRAVYGALNKQTRR